MYKIMIFFLATLVSTGLRQLFHETGKPFHVVAGIHAENNRQPILLTLCEQFDSINTLVRDKKIAQGAALQQLQVIIPKIKAEYIRQRGKNFQPSPLVFPLKGYTSRVIGGVNGNGYIAKGYSYFDGNKHSGHPAHDIFITDKNQDCIDDKTHKHVPVLSMSDGVVVSTVNEWDTASDLRGGKYAWIYDPNTNSLFYYAHNDHLMVTIGQLVKAGDSIAVVGRTGFNAFKKRSPTHLHITRLQFDDSFYPRTVDLYPVLLKAELR